MSNVKIGQFIESFDNKKIFCREWDDVKTPKGVVLIIHGMVEHSGRYQEFAKYLNTLGFVVFGFDLRAHGQTSESVEKISQYDGDLFCDCVKDAMFFSDMLIEKYKLPLIVFGHSFGSFVLQSYVQHYDKQNAVIFCGSANMKNNSSVTLGKFVAGVTKLFCGGNAKCKLIYKLSFGAYGKNFANKNWLSQNEQNWIDYNNDTYCGAVCSANFYRSFFKGLKNLYKKENLEQIDLTIPILITSGSDDPVGGKNLNLTKKLVEMYKDLGVEYVDFKVWEGDRHEILNETNKLEVWKYIGKFCCDFLSKK